MATPPRPFAPPMPALPQGNLAPFQHDRTMDNNLAAGMPMPGRTGLSSIPAIMHRRRLKAGKK